MTSTGQSVLTVSSRLSYDGRRLQNNRSGSTKLMCHVFRATKLCAIAPDICRPSENNLLHFTLLALSILTWLPDIFAPLSKGTVCEDVLLGIQYARFKSPHF